MRFAFFTLGFGAIGGVACAVYRAITWHNSCGMRGFGEVCLTRGQSTAFLGFVGFLAGGLVGLFVWFVWRMAEEERLAMERRARGPDGEPEPDADPEPDVTGPSLD
jgi:hypothetical protein